MLANMCCIAESLLNGTIPLRDIQASACYVAESFVSDAEERSGLPLHTSNYVQHDVKSLSDSSLCIQIQEQHHEQFAKHADKKDQIHITCRRSER